MAAVTPPSVQTDAYIGLHLSKVESKVLKTFLCKCIQWDNSAFGKVCKGIYLALMDHHGVKNSFELRFEPHDDALLKEVSGRTLQQLEED